MQRSHTEQLQPRDPDPRGPQPSLLTVRSYLLAGFHRGIGRYRGDFVRRPHIRPGEFISTKIFLSSHKPETGIS